MVDHLYNLHFGVAAPMTMSLVEALPVDHPIRIYVKPFTYRTTAVNNEAGEGMLLGVTCSDSHLLSFGNCAS